MASGNEPQPMFSYEFVSGVSSSSGFVDVTFSKSYSTAPLVFCSTNNANSSTLVAPKIANISTTGCKVGMIGNTNNFLNQVSFTLMVIEK